MSIRILNIVDVLYDAAEQLSINIPSFSQLYKKHSVQKNDTDEITEHDIYRFILEDIQETFDCFLFNDPQKGLGGQQESITKPFFVSALNAVYLSNLKTSLLRFISKNTAKELSSIYFSDYKEDKNGREYINDEEYTVYQGDGEAILKPLEAILTQITYILSENVSFIEPEPIESPLTSENLKRKMLNELHPTFLECGLQIKAIDFINSLLIFLTTGKYDGLKLGSYKEDILRKKLNSLFFYSLYEASLHYSGKTGSRYTNKSIANYLSKCLEKSPKVDSMTTYINANSGNNTLMRSPVALYHKKLKERLSTF